MKRMIAILAVLAFVVAVPPAEGHTCHAAQDCSANAAYVCTDSKGKPYVSETPCAIDNVGTMVN